MSKVGIGMEDIYRILECLEQPGKKVLATIIAVAGSAYKKEGSMMLLFEDESRIGMLSAGCLESDLALQAQEVFQKWKVKTLQYDMREETDLAWGQGAGCNGTIDILLEPVTETLQDDLLKIKRLLESNLQVKALKKLGNTGEYLFIPSEGGPFGQWKGEVPTFLSEKRCGMMPDLPIFQQLFQAKPRLFVFGAGPDAMPVVSLAANIGFSVTVCDWREEFCRKKNFPSADRLLIGFPNEFLKKISFSPNDFAVIMSHHFQRDQEILLSLLQKDLRYLGVLGPRARTKRLLKVESIPDWISSPIGASIGAKGPEEIAVSIVAQMIEVWRNFSREPVENLRAIPD